MRHLLFVCTGNTCRSPMAEVLYNRYCKTGSAQSCGLSACDGMPASGGAQRAVAAYGCSLNGHTARQADAALLRDADEVRCMTARHAALLKEMFPQHAEKILPLSRDIPDPFGGSDGIYADVCAMIYDEIQKLEGNAPDDN